MIQPDCDQPLLVADGLSKWYGKQLACQIAKPEHSPAGVKQPEPDKLINGVNGELAQCGNLIGRMGPIL